MTFEMNDTRAKSADTKELQRWAEALQRYLTTRLLIVMAVLVLFTVVSVDSFQNTASAADISTSEVEASVLSVFSTELQAETLPQPTVREEDHPSDNTYLEFDSETAARLRRSGLTSASMTRSRLTDAHLFTRRMQ
ncbi:MAG: hypothetical protein ACFBSF_17770 [Leptolyngbyaceae cyanobacterium]